MTSQQGEFVWYELMTTDVAGAAAFYGAVVGWTSRAGDAAGPSGYHLFSTGGTEVAGFMPLPPDAPAPGWIGYIGVEDVDALATAVLADGGHQYMPPTDIPGVGRFAVLADPQRAVFSVIRGAEAVPSRAFSPTEAGHCRWNELSTTEPDAALAFYTRHFGWTKGEPMPMGEAGVYQLLEHGGVAFGAISPAGPEVPRPMWCFYFGVADIDATLARIGEAGGRVLHGPHEVPGEEFIVIGLDPQGAQFAVVGPRGK